MTATLDACHLLGASVIISGLSPKIAQTLVTLGVDLSKIHTMGDLQGCLEEAEHLLGYTVTREAGAASSCSRNRHSSPSCARTPT